MLLSFLFVLSCSKGDEVTASPVAVEKPEPTPEPVKYTFTVTASEGGSVSSQGGTYDEGTQVGVMAVANDGYEFTGWEGSDASTNSLTITLNANTTIKALFQQVELSYYHAGPLKQDSSLGEVFDRSLTVNGIKIVVAGAVGGQKAVPDEWAKKIARMFQLITDPNAPGIDSQAQINMIKTLRGDAGTWHHNYPTVQRIGYGGGDEYSINWLRDEGIEYYKAYANFLNSHSHNDMVWYRNSSGETFDDGDADFQEVMEHVMHTIHLFGVPGGVTNSEEDLFKDGIPNSKWKTTPLYLAMKEAIDNNMFVPDYHPELDIEDYLNNEDVAQMAYKEYLYLLNFNMWEMSEFWEGESLAPEWHDSMRTPQGIQTNNPKGYELHNTYIEPVLSKPDFTTIRAIFQNNDQGDSGYVAD